MNNVFELERLMIERSEQMLSGSLGREVKLRFAYGLAAVCFFGVLL